MYKAYWGMEFNPFKKDINSLEKNSHKSYESKDFKNAVSRLEYLKTTRGIGLFTGLSGTGKTYTLKTFASNLNTSLYKLVYIPLSTVTVIEFYKGLAYGLDLEPPTRKIDLFRAIQSRIITLSKERRITPVIILDEAQYLKTAVLNDIKLLLNFEMDSKNHAIFILAGQPVLVNILSKQVHEALKQRIVINYNFEGISKEEVKEYLTTRLTQCGVHTQIFDTSAIEATYACCNGSIRILNSLIDKCLLVGYMDKSDIINSDIVMNAVNDMNLI